MELDSQANICHFKDQKVCQTSSESAIEEEKIDHRVNKLPQKLLINQQGQKLLLFVKVVPQD